MLELDLRGGVDLEKLANLALWVTLELVKSQIFEALDDLNENLEVVDL